MPNAACPNRSDNCPKVVANGCCRTPSVCCHEKTDFQQALQDYVDEINAFKLQKRLLSDKFKKRPSSKCDDFKRQRQKAFKRECKEIQTEIDLRVRNIAKLKNAKKASQTTRDKDSFCNRGGVCSC